jgi:lipoyl(octanoyl) transferase
MLTGLYSPADWRVIVSPPAPGARNMALDEAILISVGKNEVLPTLRLYAWEPACLSLGYAQPVADVDRDKLDARDWDLVRRPTGGRAILHTDELTYSVCAPVNEPRVAGGVLESYSRLAEALLQALLLLGLPAESKESYSPITTSRIPNPVCFEVPSNYEITANGKKIIGSAQARRKEGVLQHGSLPLFGDLTRITQVLRFSDEFSRQAAAQHLLERATTASDLQLKPVSWEQAASAFIQAFAESLNLSLDMGTQTINEQHNADRLVKERYSQSSWTNRI